MRGKIGIPFLALALLLAFASPSGAPNPEIKVTKYCQNSVGMGEPITFNGTVTNASIYEEWGLQITVVDDHAGLVWSGFLAGGESANFSGSYIPTTSPSTNIVTATGTLGTVTVTATASATCTYSPGCRVTGGGNDTAGVAYDGFNWDGTFAEGKSHNNGGFNRYTFGGQAGAKTALQPQPSGEWTHHQQSGPSGRFVFHGGTSSSDQYTEIDRIICSDPGGCRPSGDPPSPLKQIDFAGVGMFKNIESADPNLAGVIAQATHHWFDVHIEDLGEPGNKPRVRPHNCPVAGSGTDAFAIPSVFMPADCGCADFYRIRIYEGFDPATEAPNKTNVIYVVYGYINGGNLQIHYPTGYDQQ